MVLTTETDSTLSEPPIEILQKPLIVVGIPAFNEEKTIARVVLSAQKQGHIVVVCDDGSTDLTAKIAERLGADVVRHEKNLGYGAALQSLFRRAREFDADILVTLDADGQHDPAEIPKLVKPIEDQVAEVVLGSRFLDKKGSAEMPAHRKLGVALITKMNNGPTKNGISDAQSGFRAYSKLALQTLGPVHENGMSASVELLRAVRKSDLNVCEVPITCKYADTVGVGTSSENSVSHGLGLILSIVKLVVEDKPLQFLGIPGVLSLAAGVYFGVWMMSLYAQSHAIVTNVALASISFILMGLFMISTAITLYAITRLSTKLKH